MGLKPEEFYIMTPYEFHEFSEQQLKRIDYENENNDRRFALIASILANAYRDKKKKNRPFTIEDFMPKRKKKEKKPMNINIMVEILKAITVTNGGEIIE